MCGDVNNLLSLENDNERVFVFLKHPNKYNYMFHLLFHLNTKDNEEFLSTSELKQCSMVCFEKK